VKGIARPEPDTQKKEGLDVGDIVELYGTDYRIVAFKPDGNAVLSKVHTDQR
jgi:hypothetical protein